MTHYTDSAGRRINILNDRDAPARHSPVSVSLPTRPYPVRSSGPTSSYGQYSTSSNRSDSPFSATPDLLRNDPYDDHSSSTEPISPMTPSPYEYPLSAVPQKYPSPAEAYPSIPQHHHRHHPHRRRESDPYATEGLPPAKRPSLQSRRSSSFDDDKSSVTGSQDAGGKPLRRYPCRFRDTHNCDKTFTTSGHASRHSKIHTAEKSVSCRFPGCPKKFTRNDNMKQHLETHNKDKSSRGHMAARSAVKLAAAASSSSSKGSSDKKHSSSKRDKAAASLEASSYGGRNAIDGSASLPRSPGLGGGAWDMRSLNGPLARAEGNSALDTLAAAAAASTMDEELSGWLNNVG